MRKRIQKKRNPKHGTTSEYNNYGCRCSDCRRANLEYTKTYINTRKESGFIEKCRFGGCNRKDVCVRGLCPYHYNLAHDLVERQNVRTWEDIELAKEKL
jgi:hypothetical protein